jgi:hypothetical protein
LMETTDFVIPFLTDRVKQRVEVFSEQARAETDRRREEGADFRGDGLLDDEELTSDPSRKGDMPLRNHPIPRAECWASPSKPPARASRAIVAGSHRNLPNESPCWSMATLALTSGVGPDFNSSLAFLARVRFPPRLDMLEPGHGVPADADVAVGDAGLDLVGEVLPFSV